MPAMAGGYSGNVQFISSGCTWAGYLYTVCMVSIQASFDDVSGLPRAPVAANAPVAVNAPAAANTLAMLRQTPMRPEPPGLPGLPVRLMGKLAILADAAKYDASCSSSGSETRDSIGGRGIGSTGGSGLCHSYAPDGRCISLLKILLTNFCTFDCLYCVNRVSSNVPRARFSVEEVVQLTLEFYKRNYIEGLFLSSGIVQSPDYTMECIVEVARQLRVVHDFRGYIHLKTIPEASP